MKKGRIRFSVIASLFVGLMVIASIQFSGPAGCFGGGEGGDRNVPEDFNELMETSNDQAATLNASLSDFATAFEEAAGASADAGLTSSQLDAVIDDFVEKGEAFDEDLQYYADLVDTYSEEVAALQTSLVPNILDPAFKDQSADPRTVLAIRNLIQGAKDGKVDCDQQYPVDEKPDENRICKSELLKRQLSETVRVGLGVTLAAGGAKVVGAACAAAAAPGVVTVAAVVGTGVAIYALWNYCTRPSSGNLVAGEILDRDSKNQEEACSTCGAVNSCATTTRELPDGRIVAICSFSPGEDGTLIIHPPDGTPVVLEDVTIDDEGITVDVSDCTGSASDATTGEAQDCNEGSSSTAGATAAGGSCADIGALTGSTSPADPSAAQDVSVTYCVFPAVSSCPTSYGVSGTDGYSASGTPTTGADGCASFTIPGGAAGVVDTVTLSETTNNNSKTIVYTF